MRIVHLAAVVAGILILIRNSISNYTQCSRWQSAGQMLPIQPEGKLALYTEV